MGSENRDDMDGEYTKPVKTKRAPRLGKSFTSRNPTPIGAIGLVFILVLLVAAFNAASLPLIGGGTSYSAMFTTSANLKEGADVRIAGVKVGEVDTVAIDRPAGLVKVTFLVKDGWVGNESFARIKLRTLLGAKYVEIDSQGTKQLKAGSTIPKSRTESPFDVYPAFTALTDTVQKIDTNQLASAFNTLSADFANTPSSVKPVVTGLSRLSLTISSRDQQLRTLLSRTNSVTTVLADRSADLQTLLADGNLLLGELNARRNAIHSLLINTQTLSLQLSGLVSDNQRTLDPLLTQVNKVLKQLNDNQDSLDRGLALLGPFYRVFNNVIGNGRWFDNYIENLSVAGVLGQILPVGE
ncbi:MlaD family protein [uncultured Jatrophihabitans sp.]|uniref:MlaD family protein n=1 Tax=uncultured Jatrophihabitans sp. TaxID=1610747 RepID=UPI0035C98A5F